MKGLAIIFLVPALAAVSKTTPIQKAIDLLGGMLRKAEASRHEERVQYASFKQFCDNVIVEKSRAVDDADGRIETLNSHVLKFDTESERLGGEIIAHKADIEQLHNESETGTEVRDTQKADFEAMHRNFTESLIALTHAISVLKSQAFDRDGKLPSALMQEATAVVSRLPAAAGRAVQSFLARNAEEPDLTFAPQVPTTAYEFRSSDIISMLENLENKFRQEVLQLEEKESTDRHAFESLMQDLKHSIDSAEDGITTKSKAQLSAQRSSDEARAALTDVTATREDDFAYLQGLNKTCIQKAADYESRQSLRDDEMQALTKAVELLSSSAVSGAAAVHLPTAALLSSRTSSFAQLRGSSAASPTQLEVADLLHEVSERVGSHELAALAVSARDDPFAKVKMLIEQLLQRLTEEAGQEATHKGWCDKELATNAHTRKTSSDAINMLAVEIENLDADIASLKQDITELNESTQLIEIDVANATEIRNAEKIENAKTVQDAKEGQVAIAEVIRVLTDFYANASKATALVQTETSRRQPDVLVQQSGQPALPPIFDSPYKGLQAESGGVLGMMEVIQSDFARLESDAVTSENLAQKEYDAFMEASAIDRAEKVTTIGHKTVAQQEKEAEVAQNRVDKATADQTLAGANTAYENLKNTCINTGMSYDERRQRRRDEIEALKEALRILSEA
eukprot:TRINITY_DN16644_c0_g1_i1.p1 TRINITY_DN16644_c0_g1~~TRINITY_DN16644_c0_g1_i1.p1  ORF type:complete len:708 (+),score=158.10 TRINITY_DN16644_c0_g1_i1:73-2124(+)